MSVLFHNSPGTLSFHNLSFSLEKFFSFRETSITDAHSAKRIDNKNSQFTFHKLVRYVVVRSSSFFTLYLALSKFIREEFNASFGSSFCFHRIALVFFVRDPLEADWSSFVARVCGFVEQSGFMLNECVRVS